MSTTQIRSIWTRFLNMKSAGVRRQRRTHPLGLEVLEARVVPAAITVPQGAVIVTQDADFSTTESKGTTHFTVVLSEAPARNKTVTVPIKSDNTKEATVGILKNGKVKTVSSLSFTSKNWNVPQEVIVTGVDDKQVDGDKTYHIVIGKLKSSAANYKTVDPADLTLVNKDNDGVPQSPGLVIKPTSLTVNEGGSKTITIALASQPKQDVGVILTPSIGELQANLSDELFHFTPANWNTPQTVTIDGVAGDGQDGDQPFEFLVESQSSDPDYAGLQPISVKVSVHDTDSAEVNLDGRYEGSYTGNAPVVGPVNGLVTFTVAGDKVTVIDPARGTGSISQGKGTFSPTAGELSGATFTGTFVKNPDGSVTASGTWKITLFGMSGSGTWTALRPVIT